MTVEVVLRDFDGSRTILPVESPLNEVIHHDQMDEIPVRKVYVKTAETDERGRVVYAER